MEYAVEINSLNKNYGEFMLRDVSFRLPSGFIMGFAGQNGAGKTTVIKSILNMIKRDSGDIKVFGKDNIADEAEIKQNIGVVTDDFFFIHAVKADLPRPGRIKTADEFCCGGFAAAG